MTDDSWRPSWIRGSEIYEITWIGKDTLAWCAGCFIIFYQVNMKRETIFWCTDSTTGDGARCVSGNATIPIFAFSEKIMEPRILVYSYPSMKKISECINNYKTGYLATAFASEDYLVSISSYPDFKMILWYWKSGHKITEVNTAIRDEVGQILRVNQFGAILVAQMGISCGGLFVWEVNIVGKICVLKDYEIKLPNDEFAFGIDWCSTLDEPLLAITDKTGHIYLSDREGTYVRQIIFSQRCNICVNYEIPTIAWFRGGILLKTTFCEIRFFKKHSEMDNWTKQWYVKSLNKPYIVVVHPFRDDWLFYYTREGFLMQIDFPEDHDVPIIQKHYQHGTVYRFVDFVYPWCYHLVTNEGLKDLLILECESGVEVAKTYLDMNGNISCQASHPDIPLVAFASVEGELVLVSVTDPMTPRIFCRMYVHEKPLDIIKFSYNGRSLVVGEKISGDCFCVNLKEEPFTMMTHLRTGRKIADVLPYDVSGGLKVLVLAVTVNSHAAGQQLMVYDVALNQTLVQECTIVLDLPTPFLDLHFVPENQQLLVGTPFLTRQLHVFQLQGWKNIEFSDGLLTNHRFRCARLFTDRRWLTTTAVDGFAIVRSKNIRNVVTISPTHHRYDLGSVKAIVNTAADTMVVLGYDGSLVAMKLPNANKDNERSIFDNDDVKNFYRVNYSIYEKRKPAILAEYANLQSFLKDLLSISSISIPSAGFDKTWVQWMEEKKLQEETRVCAERKAAILEDLAKLKQSVVKMLDKNEFVAEIERLPISVFDLDQAMREQRFEEAEEMLEKTRNQLEQECVLKDRVARWIKTTFWDQQTVLSKSIFSMFDDTEVTNYAMTIDKIYTKDALAMAEFERESERTIVQTGSFVPWLIQTESEIRLQLERDIRFSRDEMQRMDVLLEQDEREIDPTEMETQSATNGTTTHRFIEESSHYYSQMESYGFGHVLLNNNFLMHDCKKLRFYFNEIFNDVYAQKEWDMLAIRERIDRMRHIDSELKIMFNKSVPLVPPEPKWNPKEKPETIIDVRSDELVAKPYVSPSQKELLRQKEVEEERIRQLLLADDFRERALMKMMDGVLEIRWEDAIKKDIPKPSCMLNKKPDEYSVEDILIVKRFEKDVDFLMEERERYKRILEADYAKTNSLLQEAIDKFNGKLQELFLLKIKIESAIKQLELRLVRGCVQNFKRVTTIEKDYSTKDAIAEKSKYTEALEEDLAILETVPQEFFAHYEALLHREKAMSKKFRSEFPSIGRAAVDFLERQFKRRPRTNLKTVNFNNLLDLAKCVVSHEIFVYLPAACKEYLKSLNLLDVRPITLSPSIETYHWESLIRLRRHKIELELRMRARQLEIDHAERIITVFNDKITRSKSSELELTKKLTELRHERKIFDQDGELQLILKMGQVEIHLRGSVTDTENAIFISRNVIHALNEKILEAGSRKLKVMAMAVDLHKDIRNVELKHRSLRLRIQYLKEDLHFVRGTNVTKEIQDYLKKRARGERYDKTAQQFEREAETMQKYYDKALSDWARKLDDLRRRNESIWRENIRLDRSITEMNVARCAMEHSRDVAGEERERKATERKMRMIMERSNLIRKIQENYTEILALQTEHELLRLKRYPALKLFKKLDNTTDEKNVC